MNLIAVCSRCKHSARNCRGACPCTIDGVDILKHAEERYCPIGRYKLGLGDIIAKLTHATGIQKFVKAVTRKKSCGGCKARQMAMNRQREANNSTEVNNG